MGDLMLEWAKSRFYSLLVRDHIPIFLEVWKVLSEKGHTSEENCYTFNDLDMHIWIEKVKNPKDKKVLVGRNSSICRDDNTYLYILSSVYYADLMEFKCRTVWPKQNKNGGYRVTITEKNPTGWFSWGDDRDIKTPSLKTYQERDFEFSYGDCRDKGHIFSYENCFGKHNLDKPTWHENEIIHALKELVYYHNTLKDYEGNKE